MLKAAHIVGFQFYNTPVCLFYMYIHPETMISGIFTIMTATSMVNSGYFWERISYILNLINFCFSILNLRVTFKIRVYLGEIIMALILLLFIAP